ncbi:MAG: zinc ribbon domain-containing protein [Candidatus Aminicenantes bacterium]|nr:zinc ribbon domain-containing protein [Candidatus Aminicenantes bacterium]
MPLYEYKCKKCGEVFEVFQKISDPPLTKCIKCGGPVVKVISSPAIQFKGSGWYITDYAHSNKRDQSKEQKTNNEKESGQDNKKSEAKNPSGISKTSNTS